MHLSLILFMLLLAVVLRSLWQLPSTTWENRWQRTLTAFLLPPLLLLTASLAVIQMGTQGNMLGLSAGRLGYWIALGFLMNGAILLGISAMQGWRSLRSIKTCPQQCQHNYAVRILPTSGLFAAQMGFWQSELVVSQGLLQTLEAKQLQAVFTHEQAHAVYRDTFWFFWLGWVRRCTDWLPKTETLWQELLLLRELRADQWAAQRVDPLLLAETLLLVVQAPHASQVAQSAAFGDNSLCRLELRISHLLESSDKKDTVGSGFPWHWLPLGLMPLLTLPFHV